MIVNERGYRGGLLSWSSDRGPDTPVTNLFSPRNVFGAVNLYHSLQTFFCGSEVRSCILTNSLRLRARVILPLCLCTAAYGVASQQVWIVFDFVTPLVKMGRLHAFCTRVDGGKRGLPPRKFFCCTGKQNVLNPFGHDMVLMHVSVQGCPTSTRLWCRITACPGACLGHLPHPLHTFWWWQARVVNKRTFLLYGRI